jgi:hypothetical protein
MALERMTRTTTGRPRKRNIQPEPVYEHGDAEQAAERNPEIGGANSEAGTRGAGEGGGQKPVLILDYPSVMVQVSVLHLRELPKYFEVVLFGNTDDFTQEDLEIMKVNAVQFTYDYPDANVRERLRAAVRKIVAEFKDAPTHYFSSLHWWVMEEASKAPVLLVPPAAVRTVANLIAQQRLDMVKSVLDQFTIKIVK